jgi:hypothetical protein
MMYGNTGMSGRSSFTFKTIGLGLLGIMGGIWLIVSPFFLDYRYVDAAYWNSIITGVIFIILVSFCVGTANQIGLLLARQVADGLKILAGIWLILAPFLFDYTGTTSALWNHIITGALFILITGYALIEPTPPASDRLQ